MGKAVAELLRKKSSTNDNPRPIKNVGISGGKKVNAHTRHDKTRTKKRGDKIPVSSARHHRPAKINFVRSRLIAAAASSTSSSSGKTRNNKKNDRRASTTNNATSAMRMKGGSGGRGRSGGVARGHYRMKLPSSSSSSSSSTGGGGMGGGRGGSDIAPPWQDVKYPEERVDDGEILLRRCQTRMEEGEGDGSNLGGR